MDRRVRQDNCTWEGCQGPHVGVELGAHLEDHAHDALARWNRQSKCTWQGCKSKAVFKRSRQLKKHLHNIHTKPLLCTEPHCTHKKPFRNKHDLERHNSTRHSIERPWECPYDSCSSEIRTFARKDKWLKHIQETPHENDAFCPFHHCRLLQSQPGKIFGDRKEIGKHFREAEHAGRNTDGYTCGLGSCGIAEKQDRWILFGLWTHLLNMHKVVIYFSESQKILRGSNRTFRLQHVPADYLDKWIDCEDCASQPEAQHLLNTTTTPFKPSEIGFL
ncbi:hypothetical protein N431DRAFT_374175 [Stipitochalara longipes BDJ]|nr:hypothetical protein N431DRAFT_374175 [Stipitochalara longipes BDJ]